MTKWGVNFWSTCRFTSWLQFVYFSYCVGLWRPVRNQESFQDKLWVRISRPNVILLNCPSDVITVLISNVNLRLTLEQLMYGAVQDKRTRVALRSSHWNEWFCSQELHYHPSDDVDTKIKSKLWGILVAFSQKGLWLLDGLQTLFTRTRCNQTCLRLKKFS